MSEPKATVSAAEPDPAPAGRLDWLRREWAITLVWILAGVGLVLVGDRRFRAGCIFVAGGMVLGAWLRALLPDRVVGLLRLRSRLTDVLVLAVFGLSTAVLALAVPSAR